MADRYARLGWLLAAVAAVVALVNVIVYYATDAFGPGWLVTSIIVYGAILVAAIALALLDRGAAATTEDAPAAAPRREPRLIERVVTYRTRDGMAVRLTYVWPDGEREVRHVTFTPGESLGLHEVEMQLDAFPKADAPASLEMDVDAALRARAFVEKEVTP